METAFRPFPFSFIRQLVSQKTLPSAGKRSQPFSLPYEHVSSYRPSYDRTPKYTVKQVAEMMEMSAYTIRYYENAGLIPDVDRSGGNARMFSDYTLGWLRLVHCLRMTGLPIEGVKHYIDLCQEGDTTIPERAELIFKQEKSLREQLRILKKQMEVLKYKKKFYQDLLNNHRPDSCNPLNHVSASEPNIAPEE